MLLSAILLFSFAATGAGQISQAIIIPDRPKPVEKAAAEELRYHLEKSTGLNLPVISEKNLTPAVKGGFFLGATSAADKLGLNITDKPLNSFRIKADDGFLYIVGHDNTRDEKRLDAAPGTLFGVYHYLQHVMGVRWLWPGATGESIPKHSAAIIDNSIDGVYPPPFQFVRGTQLKSPDEFRWGRRVMHISDADYLRHARDGHGFGGQWAARYGKEHPEWFALRSDGQRDIRKHSAMCISNEKFQDQIVSNWWNVQSRYPAINLLLSLKENDTQDRCTCAGCLALDGPDDRGPTGRYDMYRNVGDRYAKFCRQVYEKAAELKPDAGVSFYAYQSYFYAPRQVRLNPNFYVGLVPDIPFPRRPEYDKWLRGEYKAWRDSGATIYLRPNYFYGGYCMPEVWYDQYAAELEYIRSLGCIGIVIDGPSLMWATRGLDTYVMGRLCTEPDTDPGKLVDEYCAAFGAGASEVRQYFEYWRQYLERNAGRINDIYEASARKWYFHGFHYAAYAHRIFPADELKKGRPFLERAAALTRGTADAAKVDFLRRGLEYAIASSECAAIFDGRENTVEQKRQAWDELKKMRATLPEQAVNPPYLDKIEKNVWKLPVAAAAPKGDVQALAERWQICPDPAGEGEKLGYFKQDFDSSRWNTASTWLNLEPQGFNHYRDMWYRTTVHVAEKSSDKVILSLGAVDESCKVWVNGQFCGELKFDAMKDPDSWKKPFEVDITDHVRFNNENTVVVKLNNKAGFGGIWKPSYLIFR
jgi:hypothetical protein